MYIMESMIEMGLKDGQEWPNGKYRAAACALLLCNSEVFTRQALIDGVQWLFTKTPEQLETMTLDDVIADETRPFNLCL